MHPGDRPADAHQPVDPVPEPQHEPPVDGRGTHPVGERLADPGAAPPRHVEPRHRVAVPAGQAVAALGPADHRREPHPALPQPRQGVARGELDERPAPAHGPRVLGQVAVQPVPARGALPVLPREVDRVPDAEPALHRAVDEEDAAERPPGLAAEVRRGLLLDEDHPSPGPHELVGGDQPRQAAAHHDDVRVHAPHPRRPRRRPVAAPAGASVASAAGSTPAARNRSGAQHEVTAARRRRHAPGRDEGPVAMTGPSWKRRRWDLNPRKGCPFTTLAGSRTRPGYATSPDCATVPGRPGTRQSGSPRRPATAVAVSARSPTPGRSASARPRARRTAPRRPDPPAPRRRAPGWCRRSTGRTPTGTRRRRAP